MSESLAPCAQSCPIARTRFLRKTALAALAGIMADSAFAVAASAQSVGATSPTHVQGKTLTYTVPARDGVLLDSENGVAIARVKSAMYALSMTCPHRAVTTLDWNPNANEFHCPKHGADFQADGDLVQGRPDRSMDRFAVRRSGGNLIVESAQLFQQDTNANAWAHAFVSVS